MDLSSCIEKKQKEFQAIVRVITLWVLILLTMILVIDSQAKTHTQFYVKKKLNDEDCYVIESTPKDEDYMYSKTITWIIKDKWIGLKKDFYDEDEDLLKTLTVDKYEDINGFFIITHTEMKNEQKDHRTIMDLKNVKIDSGISKSKFSERMMTRGM